MRPTWGAGSASHPSEDRLRDLYATFAKGDLPGWLAGCTDDVTFTVPGDTTVSGTFTRDQFTDWIAGVLGQTGGTIKGHAHELATKRRPAVGFSPGRPADRPRFHVVCSAPVDARRFWPIRGSRTGLASFGGEKATPSCRFLANPARSTRSPPTNWRQSDAQLSVSRRSEPSAREHRPGWRVRAPGTGFLASRRRRGAGRSCLPPGGGASLMVRHGERGPYPGGPVRPDGREPTLSPFAPHRRRARCRAGGTR